MNYKSLEIWKLADKIVCEIHEMTLFDLPKFELFETGSQIRRSSKSIKSNIVEGYGRRFYQLEYLHFLTISQASADETMDHLETLFKIKSLRNYEKYEQLREKLDKFGRKLNLFIQKIRKDLKMKS